MTIVVSLILAFMLTISGALSKPTSTDLKLAHNLKTIKAPKNQTALTVTYVDNQDKVMSLASGDATVRYTLSDTQPSVLDSRNNEKKFTLENGQIKSIIEDAAIAPTRFEYENGLLQKVTYPRNNVVQYNYTDGLLKTITESPSPEAVEDPEYPVEFNRTTAFNYENFTNHLLSIDYPGGLSQNYSYNEFGQTTSEYATMVYGGQDIPVGQTLFYEYHPESNPGGTIPTMENTRTLNLTTGGYLKRSTASFGEIPHPDDWGYWENYSYDPRGNLSGLKSYSNINAEYTTNIFNQVTHESISSPVVDSLSPLSYTGDYTYDKNGNLENETVSSGLLTRTGTYSYDVRNNLVTADDSQQGLSTYSYDANDNVTSISSPGGTMSFTYTSRDLVQTATIGDYTYGFTYDTNGNVATFTDPFGHVTSYGYDGYDRLNQVKNNGVRYFIFHGGMIRGK